MVESMLGQRQFSIDFTEYATVYATAKDQPY